jgi:arsenite methyltransferase
MENREQERIRQAVREHYSQIVEPNAKAIKDKKTIASCCSTSSSASSHPLNGCGCSSKQSLDLSSEEFQLMLGYTKQDLMSAPEGANLGLGCGNPLALASLASGETVVDLGSGAGFDCFLAANRVGPKGHVIGVDMTPEMVDKARLNADKVKAGHVEFRIGTIEHLPVADNYADMIMSNCVINLSPDKNQVYREAFRVLKPGGRLAISDIVTSEPLPPEIKKDLALISACIGGAATIEDTRRLMEMAGFTDIRIDAHPIGDEVVNTYAPGSKARDFIFSASIKARKP